MNKSASELLNILYFAIGFSSAILLVVFFPGQRVCDRCAKVDSNMSCNCTINYGGHNMSVEDAFERAGEGLTVDQADEVEILIEEYCNASK